MAQKKRKAAGATTKRKRGGGVPLKRVTQLMNLRGNMVRVAKELGTTTTTLYRAMSMGEISKPLEIAAEGILRSEGVALEENPVTRNSESGKEVSVLYLLQVAASKSGAVEQFAAAIGATLTKHAA